MTQPPSQLTLAFEDAAAPAGPPTTAELLAELARWCDAGWLRRLDVALATWLAEELPGARPELLLSAALLAQRESRGHTCVPLDALLDQRRAEAGALSDDDVWLDGPAAARAALAALLTRLAPTLPAWCAALRVGGAVAEPGVRPVPGAPLVLEAGERLYLRRHWRDEQAVAQAVRARVAADPHAGDATPPPDPAAAHRWLDRLFGPPADDAPDWQRIACAVALRGRLALVTGGPGTGKTYTVARLLALSFALHPAPATLRIALAAPTGKAAARLQQSIHGALDGLAAQQPDALDWPRLRERTAEALTLHRLLGARPDTRALRHDARHPLDVDLLVVDEASMVHLEMMAALLAALPARARLVLLGDKDQLASVEAGAVLGDFCADAADGHYDAASVRWVQACTGVALPAALRHSGGAGVSVLAQQTVMLRRSRRFDGAIGQLAQAVNAGDVRAADAVLRAGDAAVRRLAVTSGAAGEVTALALAGYAAYLQQLADAPLPTEADAHRDSAVRAVRAFERFRLLCALREGDWGVTGLNQRIEAALRQRGLLRGGEWHVGRPVMVTRNDPALGVHNGDVGLALPSADGRSLRVWFVDGDGQAPRSVMASRLAAVETAWAMTVHKSQGSEFEHVALVLPPQMSPVLTRELVYTGITRARQRFTLVAPDATVWARALQRRTRRVSGLPGLLAQRLDVDPG
jgi:exodeoxyribonuclease V alpha subunit